MTASTNLYIYAKQYLLRYIHLWTWAIHYISLMYFMMLCFLFFHPIDECQLCHPSCQTCSGSLAWDCLTCPDEEFLHSDNTCDAHCPYSTYADQTDKMCKPCFENCLTCRGPGFNDCETCTVDYFWQSK